MYLLSRSVLFDDEFGYVFLSSSQWDGAIDVTHVFLCYQTKSHGKESALRWQDQQSKTCSVLPQGYISSPLLSHSLLPKGLYYLAIPQGVLLFSYTHNTRSFAPSMPNVGTTMDLSVDLVQTGLWAINPTKIEGLCTSAELLGVQWDIHIYPF